MKNITLYVCEVCGTQYKSKGECEVCENNHKTKCEIYGMRYLPYSQDKTGMPISIDIVIDGKTYRYKR